jgi:hypothetical protein
LNLNSQHSSTSMCRSGWCGPPSRNSEHESHLSNEINGSIDQPLTCWPHHTGMIQPAINNTVQSATGSPDSLCHQISCSLLCLKFETPFYFSIPEASTLFPMDREFQKFCNTSWTWWCMLVIPATWEAEVGGSWSEAGPRQQHKTLADKQTTA